ncbi:tetratricopeptide repeat protein 33 [Rhipicephalus sanguineus]|uniref:tetratricopeptide repeat protein 33 n=1 Tax=Rhipicephalus sanguineus TaxID=34632 RepID=UPI001893C6AF|nr:tetratricopeptide repeat protein 33 [Rhipicephalus sanguineus]
MKATAFGWKRKASGKVATGLATAFAENCADENADPPEGVDWLSGYKRRRNLLLEDCAQKSRRLRQEGTTLAELDRCWEALKKFDEALQLTPGDVEIHEMRAQVLMLLREDFAAVQEAEQVVKLDPSWWVAHQTLGRAQLQLGEIQMALRSFCSAVHLNPADEELRTEDLLYTLQLLRKKQVAEESAKETPVCFDEDGNVVEVPDTEAPKPELVRCREIR